MHIRMNARYERSIIIGVLGLLLLLSWTAMISPAGSLLALGMGHDHASGPTGGVESPGALAGIGLFVAAWTAMTMAMMLPTSLPMIATFAKLASNRPHRTSRVVLFVLGYLAAWVEFGLIAYLGDRPLHLAADVGWLPENVTPLLSAFVLLLAGVYQFTPIKRQCLSKCRSPMSFLMSHWREGRRGALSLGLRHGMWCVGCCWVLMLLMFALGAAQLTWMLVLTLLMFVEKVVRRGEIAGYGAGVLFIGWGLATLWTAVL